MLAQLRRSVHLCFSSGDDRVMAEIETVGTLFQKDAERFHLVLMEPLFRESPLAELGGLFPVPASVGTTVATTPRLLWLEFSPYRVALTMQGNGQFSYRHLFEPSVFGVSRFWLHEADMGQTGEFRLRNFTRNLHLKGSPLPRLLLLEYELWAEQMLLGDYSLSLEIHD